VSTSAAVDRRDQPLAFARRQLSERPWLLLVPLLLVMLAVPYVGPQINPNLTGDESGYLRLAGNIVHGHYLTGRDDEVTGGDHYPNLWFGPGLPLVLAPFVAADAPVSLVRLLGPLFLFGACLLFYGFLRLYVSRRASLIGAAAVALYLPFYTALEHLYSETLAVLLVVALLYGTRRYLHEGGIRYLALAGGAMGWLALTRVAFGWIVTIVLAATLVWWGIGRSRSARRFATVCCVALVVCVPWLAYTYSVTERPFYWGSSGALSLYWMSSTAPGERGDWQQARAVFADPNLASHRPFFRSLVGRPLVEQNDELMHAAFSNIRRRPARYAENVVANVSRMLFDFPYSFRPERLAPLLFVVPNALLLAALLASIGLLLARRAVLQSEAVPFTLFALTTFVFSALLAAYPRMLFPIVPVIVWVVVVTVSRCVRVVPEERRS
jgi:4-amino-4-deoxy-L-arabinose transferase-like glycosyltransferase